MLELFSKIIRYSLIVIPLFHINLNDTDITEYDYTEYDLTEIKIIETEPWDMAMMNMPLEDTMNILTTEHCYLYNNSALSLFFVFIL
jgi:hypothetical protein